MYTVDASVWVNGFDQREAGHEISRQFLDAIRLRKVPIIVPNLVLIEVAAAISRTRHNPSLSLCLSLDLISEISWILGIGKG
jgi:predicted nucleic acid-binding protein